MTFVNKFKGYKIVFKKSAEKDLAKLPADIALFIEDQIEEITKDEGKLDIIKLTGYSTPSYRLKLRKYRVIFEDHGHIITILVVSVSHRKDAY